MSFSTTAYIINGGSGMDIKNSLGVIILFLSLGIFQAGCSTSQGGILMAYNDPEFVSLAGTPLFPAAKGSLSIEIENGRIPAKITVEISGVKENANYSVWIIEESGNIWKGPQALWVGSFQSDQNGAAIHKTVDSGGFISRPHDPTKKKRVLVFLQPKDGPQMLESLKLALTSR